MSLDTGQPAAPDGPPATDPLAVPSAVPPVSVWNIANMLTMLRIALVPVFTMFLIHDHGRSTGWRLAAAAVFFAASITDRFDGELARKRGLVTDFGKIADPIADKALMGAALIGLSALGGLWWWVTVVILVRELGITLLRFWVIRIGVIAASRGGKLKTLLQAMAIFGYVLPFGAAHGFWSWLHPAATVLMAAALVATVVTGGDYVMRALALRRGAPGGRANSAAPAEVPAEVPAEPSVADGGPV
ncbi:MAG TPA: CDP-diacylglycerol--glycerol-3-phosphate 3-phosphatidyltransferase [Actinocrinis sp.]|nr:CDP-diacylglycerol--glycerol-3-phosphate 3-phosphatidyltransferase [Actinocrinis sp.]